MNSCSCVVFCPAILLSFPFHVCIFVWNEKQKTLIRVAKYLALESISVFARFSADGLVFQLSKIKKLKILKYIRQQ